MAKFYTLTDSAMDILKKFEGYSAKAYRDKINGKYDVPTIGYGTISYPNGKAVKMGDTCTQAEAKKYLEYELEKSKIPNVNKYDDIYHWNHNEFSALVVFAYNIGSIDGLTAKGTRTRAQIRTAWPLYCKFAGKKCQGLVNRRKAELKLFNTGMATVDNAPAQKDPPTEKAKPFNPKKSQRFLQLLDKYNWYISKNNKKFSYKAAPVRHWEDIVKDLKAGKKVTSCCVAPSRWAMLELGINTKYTIHAEKGKFKNFSSPATSYMKRIKSGGPIGLTLKQAADKGLLKAGDLIAFKNCTHTVVYSGYKYTVYDGGSIAYKKCKYSKIKLDYSYHTYKNKPISEIIRWKESPTKLKKYKGTWPSFSSKRNYYKLNDGISTLKDCRNEIKNVQRLLAWAGYYQGSIDGKYGAGTKNAVKQLQKDYGLSADGSFGKKTLELCKAIKR